MKATRHVLAWIIRLYQLTLSRLLPPSCRFEPSCSEYARQALLRHGVWRGGWLALRRLVRCNPFSPGGRDPVPGTPESDDCTGRINQS